MLKPAVKTPSQKTVRIADASYPSVFPHGLEFNPPAHGVWNIVHVGMLLPEARQIYVCAENCMRGVILTAAEMGASDRFSFVILREEDLLEGSVENVTLEGVTDVLNRLDTLPPVVLLFTVCTHRFLGSDLDYIYGNLEHRFPDVKFIRCTMEPITQKEGPSPDCKLRRSIYEPLLNLPENPAHVAVLGGDFRLDEDSDIRRMVQSAGRKLLEIQQYNRFEDFRTMGDACLMLSVFPRAELGAADTAKRLGRKHLYLPASFSYQEIVDQNERLAACLGTLPPDPETEIRACEEAISSAYAEIGDTPVVIDYTAHPRPLGLAKLLLTHGFNVKTVYLDAVTAEEAAAFRFLQEQYGDLRLASVLQPGGRMVPRTSEEKTLAVGQIAAWFAATPYFVNVVEGAGMQGFSGIRHMMNLLRDANMTEKDTRDLIPRKGLGCESCV